jgi:hypothetical protein
MADPTWGNRPDGSPKGNGWLGVLKRPDGGVSTEISAQFDNILGGSPIPLLVPTLTPEEIQAMLIHKQGDPIPQSIRQKAVEHALMRDKMGLSPFKD